jgi:hypothetical protein
MTPIEGRPPPQYLAPTDLAAPLATLAPLPATIPAGYDVLWVDRERVSSESEDDSPPPPKPGRAGAGAGAEKVSDQDDAAAGGMLLHGVIPARAMLRAPNAARSNDWRKSWRMT